MLFINQTKHNTMYRLQAKTKVKLGATAGLRLLPEGKADKILAAVSQYLQNSPFTLDAKTGVTVLDGTLPHRLFLRWKSDCPGCEGQARVCMPCLLCRSLHALALPAGQAQVSPDDALQ